MKNFRTDVISAECKCKPSSEDEAGSWVEGEFGPRWVGDASTPEGTALQAAEKAQYPSGRGHTLAEAESRKAERDRQAATSAGPPAGAAVKK